MSEEEPLRRRPPRADALRNRERLLSAATEVFSKGGADAGLEGVARRAGLGIGTLYRHFPTREALFEAVYRREVQQLADLARQLAGSDEEPVEALRRWLHANIALVATKKGMLAALALVLDGSSELIRSSSASLTDAVGILIRRAASQGLIRTDVDAADVIRAAIGMCYVSDRPEWRASASRLVDVFVDGLAASARR